MFSSCRCDCHCTYVCFIITLFFLLLLLRSLFFLLLLFQFLFANNLRLNLASLSHAFNQNKKKTLEESTLGACESALALDYVCVGRFRIKLSHFHSICAARKSHIQIRCQMQPPKKVVTLFFVSVETNDNNNKIKLSTFISFNSILN